MRDPSEPRNVRLGEFNPRTVWAVVEEDPDPGRVVKPLWELVSPAPLDWYSLPGEVTRGVWYWSGDGAPSLRGVPVELIRADR